ncbi:hypothetical protein HMPREF3180_00241 [Leptotrichia wadei]|uniref:DUF4878 domain-containing protein n=3 Tax=Leptotrichia wadei TaxID=157687 RepID=A0A134APY6_9FUSO|nr:hypothetical protein HMPREF9015_00552 [Leptotrichia wadei F0279]KXB69743.1 hypothetical protein HMPREF3180_00241 [Leptotrichia wadei]
MTKFLEENMKKYLCLFILLILTSCTTLSSTVNNVSQVEAGKINAEITKITEDFKNAASLNEYDKLKEVFLPTFKNNIIVKKIQEYDLSGLTFVFSDVNVVSKNKANSMMVINFATASNYYKLTWKRTDDNLWKISNVAEKK